MTSAPTPSYERPPVAEVALGVYFSSALPLRSAHFGKLWDVWRDRYPRTEDQPPLPPATFETFPSPPQVMSIQFAGAFPGVRAWYLSEVGDRVVQVQSDRLVLNWRRVSAEQPYPRYENLRPAFVEALEQLTTFCESEGLGPVTIAQAEVTYANPVPVESLGPDKDLGLLLAPWAGTYSDDFLPTAEDVRFGARYRIPDPATREPVGRLYVECNPTLHVLPGNAEPEDVYLLRLFARGKPLGTGVEGGMAFLDLGHEWVVRGFTSLTARPMHEEWGLQE